MRFPSTKNRNYEYVDYEFIIVNVIIELKDCSRSLKVMSRSGNISETVQDTDAVTLDSEH